MSSSSAPAIGDLTDRHLPQLFELRRTGFGSAENPADPDVRTRQLGRLPYTRGVFAPGEANERLLAAVTWFPFEAWVGGARREIGALAAVMSRPEARRRGHVAALLRDGFGRLRERGVGWSLEHPFDPRFYARYGYQSVPNGVSLELRTEVLAAGRGPDARQIEKSDAAARERIAAIHRDFAARQQFALTRGAPVGGRRPWDDLFEPSNASRVVAAYLLEAHDAYAFVELRGFGAEGTLEVVDLAWRGADDRAALLTFLGTFAGQLHRTELHLPAGDPLALDWAGRHDGERPVLQARVVDLAAALRPLTLPAGFGTRTLTLELRDDACPWNAGTWTLELGEAGTRVSPAREPADPPRVALGQRDLVRALTGTPPATLVAGGAAGDPAALNALCALALERRPFLAVADFF